MEFSFSFFLFLDIIIHTLQRYMYMWDCFEMGTIDESVRKNSSSYNNGLIRMADIISECITSMRSFCFNQYKLENEIKNMDSGSDPYIYKRNSTISLFFRTQNITNDGITRNIFVPKYTAKGFYYNKKSVRIIDNIRIPDATYVTLSLGDKFTYQSRFTEEIYKEYQDTINNSLNTMEFVDFDSITKMKQRLENIKFDNMKRCISTDKHENSIKGYLRQCLYTTNLFFKAFKQIITIHTDKGNSMVILYKNTYYNKMYQHLDDGINNGTYNMCTLNSIIERKQKDAGYTIFSLYFKWLGNLKNNCINIMPKKLTKHLSNKEFEFYAGHIYGTLKVHKEGNPIRPIVADFNSPIIYIQKMLKEVLNQYISKDRFPFIIKNNYQIIDYCHGAYIKNEHRLATLDYVSMYTNIVLQDFYDIIYNEYDVLDIACKFSIDKEDLIVLIKRCMNCFSYVKFKKPNELEAIYEQAKGIPMGGSLSYHISEVVTSRHIEEIICRSGQHNILKIFKYVDDILIICTNSFLQDTSIIDQCLGNMKYELSLEDDNKQVVFLNMQLYRHNDGKIMHRWYNKPYSSGRTTDYFSDQPRHVKDNVLKQLYHTIMMTSSVNKELGTEKFRHIGKINHYPKKYINDVINEYNN